MSQVDRDMASAANEGGKHTEQRSGSTFGKFNRGKATADQRDPNKGTKDHGSQDTDWHDPTAGDGLGFN